MLSLAHHMTLLSSESSFSVFGGMNCLQSFIFPLFCSVGALGNQILHD